jgi:oligopeptide transport system substrate-binding protein
VGAVDGARRTDSLVRAIGGDPATLDPQRAGDTFSFEVLRDLFEGLTTESPTGDVIPGAAARWTISSDGLTYDFFLRPNGRWSNGEVVTAGDFVRALRYAIDPKTGSPQSDFLKSIVGARDILEGRAPRVNLGVREVDSLHLSINLESPTPYFLTLLSNSVAYPRYRDSESAVLVSNGAYRLSAWIPGAKVVLEKSAHYHDIKNVYFRKVTYIPMVDAFTQSRAFRSGEVDVTDSVPDSEAMISHQPTTSEMQVGNQLAVVYYVFNSTKSPLKDSADLREALMLAVDRTKLVSQVLGGGQLPALSFVPAGIKDYLPVPTTSILMIGGATANIQRARRLYRSAGYSEEHPLSIVLLCPTDSSRRVVSLAISEMWRQSLGINVQLVYLDYRAYLAARSDNRRWDVLSEGWNADFQDPFDFLDVFSSDSPQNAYGFSDDIFDELIRRSGRVTGLSERYEMLVAAERELLGARVVLPLYFPVTRRFVNRRIQNAIVSPMNHNYSKYWSAVN